MATIRDYVLTHTQLPKIGVHTMKEHFLSVAPEIIAKLGGNISLSSSSYNLLISSNPTDILISEKRVEILIDSPKQNIEISSIKEVNIVISCD